MATDKSVPATRLYVKSLSMCTSMTYTSSSRYVSNWELNFGGNFNVVAGSVEGGRSETEGN